MIHWLNPAALAGLALLALPILIHLLRTRQAERIPFPSLRFVLPSETAAVRLRLPADWLLLLVRLAIVAAAVTAVAGPVIVTPSRVRAWNARTARAVIVDTSAGIPAADASGKGPLDAAREVAAIEERSARHRRANRERQRERRPGSRNELVVAGSACPSRDRRDLRLPRGHAVGRSPRRCAR